MALDECFTIVVSDSPKLWVYTTHVKGFTYNLSNVRFSGDIWLDTQANARVAWHASHTSGRRGF